MGMLVLKEDIMQTNLLHQCGCQTITYDLEKQILIYSQNEQKMFLTFEIKLIYIEANSIRQQGSRNRFSYFWRLKKEIVGPLSEDRLSGSGFFIGGEGLEDKQQIQIPNRASWVQK